MPKYVCVTCGTQYPESAQPPAHCPICGDERQYINPDGQGWTTLTDLRLDRHMLIEPLEPGVHRLKPEPKAGIGQFAHLIQTPGGNILWDCVPFLDDATITTIRSWGGIQAIAISHPHFYTMNAEWSAAFGDVPVYLHAADRQHVMQPHANIHFWEGETLPLWDGITLIHCGGHFAGSSVLHWRDGAEGRGVLFTADTIDVVSDTRFVTFMYSYPNQIPLPPSRVRKIVAAVEPFNYDRIYEGFGLILDGDAKTKVHASADRYIRALTEPGL